jgi:hypothetical protein
MPEAIHKPKPDDDARGGAAAADGSDSRMEAESRSAVDAVADAPGGSRERHDHDSSTTMGDGGGFPFQNPGPQSDFFVYCSTCQGLREGKLRVRCAVCLSGAFTVLRDPEGWDDVLQPNQVSLHLYAYRLRTVFPLPSKADTMVKYKLMENLHVLSRPEFSAFSNGAFLSPVSTVLTAEMEFECKQSFGQ